MKRLGGHVGRGALGAVLASFSRGAPRRLARDRYKEVWNAISGSEKDAMIAVAGNSDEATYASAANVTLAMLKASVGVESSDVVLEIGAGVWRVGSVLAPVCREWIGTDVSDNMVGHMKRRLSGFGNVRALATNGYDLQPVASASVDLVYCTVVFMHLDEWDRYGYVLEAFRVLKPGGRLFVDNLDLLSEGGWAIFEEHRAFPPGRRRPNISKTSTPQEVARYFRKAGFGDIQQREADPFILTFASRERRPADPGPGAETVRSRLPANPRASEGWPLSRP